MKWTKVNWDRFWDCISKLCGVEFPEELKRNYQQDSDYIIKIQDFIGSHCELCTTYDYPTLVIVEMAETYAEFES